MSNRKLFEKEPELLDRMTELYGFDAENTAVLLYFDKICPFLTKMDSEEAGVLIKALVHYALTGEAPAISQLQVEIAFDVIRPSIDRKQREYRENHARGVIHGKYMAYCRERKGTVKLTEEEYARNLLRGKKLPEAADSVPEAADSVPEAAYSVPEAADSVPEAACSKPEAADSVPEAAVSSKNHNHNHNQNHTQNQNQKQKQKQKEAQNQDQNRLPPYTPPDPREFEALRREGIRRLTEYMKAESGQAGGKNRTFCPGS